VHQFVGLVMAIKGLEETHTYVVRQVGVPLETGISGCIMDGVGEEILCLVGAEFGDGELRLDVFKESLWFPGPSV
jgi:hypothetical protein